MLRLWRGCEDGEDTAELVVDMAAERYSDLSEQTEDVPDPNGPARLKVH